MEIQLPGFVFAELYRDHLVIVPSDKNTADAIKKPNKDKEINTTKTDSSLPQKKFWLGENNRNITILIQDTANVFIDEHALQFLTNILSACKFNLSDVAIVNIANTPASYKEAATELKSRHILLFGVHEAQISLSEKLNLFETKVFNDIRVLSAPSLESLMQTTPDAKINKGKLWGELKKMFGL